MSEASMAAALDAEDAKLVTLARGARERIRADRGAAVRDDTGRTYAAADALLPSISLSALQVVAAQAWISGARGLEAAVIVTTQPDQLPDASALVDIAGRQLRVIVCSPDGTVARVTTAGDISGLDPML